MGFKSLFVKEDITPVIVAPKVSTVVSPGAKIVPRVPFRVSTPVSNVDLEIKEALLQSMQENKLQGFDYLKFQATLEETKELASDEGSRFKMASIAAKQLGVDKAKLVSSANHYLGILESDTKDFQKDFKKKIDNTIGGAETKLSQLEKSIQNAENTINSLQAEIQLAQKEHEELTSQISSDKLSLESKKAAFEATADSLKEEINDTVNKINQYL